MSSEEDHGKVDASATADPSQNTVRFEIKKWNAVTMWSWDICADTCAICRNSLNEPSIEYQVLRFSRTDLFLWFSQFRILRLSSSFLKDHMTAYLNSLIL